MSCGQNNSRVEEQLFSRLNVPVRAKYLTIYLVIMNHIVRGVTIARLFCWLLTGPGIAPSVVEVLCVQLPSLVGVHLLFNLEAGFCSTAARKTDERNQSYFYGNSALLCVPCLNRDCPGPAQCVYVVTSHHHNRKNCGEGVQFHDHKLREQWCLGHLQQGNRIPSPIPMQFVGRASCVCWVALKFLSRNFWRVSEQWKGSRYWPNLCRGLGLSLPLSLSQCVIPHNQEILALILHFREQCSMYLFDVYIFHPQQYSQYSSYMTS